MEFQFILGDLGYLNKRQEFRISGQLVDTKNYLAMGAIPAAWHIFSGIITPTSLYKSGGGQTGVGLTDALQYYPADRPYEENIAKRIGRVLQISVFPKAGATTFQGTNVTYSVFQEKGRFLEQVHVSDGVPGRIPWDMYQVAADNGVPTDRIELHLVSVKWE
jgi:hypothetical protein